MLYLPPHIAHDGVAVDACTTYSIGFRAPGATELGAAFLDFLRDELQLPGRYADADLRPVTSPRRSAPQCTAAIRDC
jgi:50S ribosomal protein L16 3-hydroxylase